MRTAAVVWAALASVAMASPAELQPRAACTRTTHTTTTFTRAGAVATKTVTRTVQGGVSTTIIPAPSGFVPIQSAIPGAVYQGSGGSAPLKRNVLVEEDALLPRAAAPDPQKVGACQTSTSTFTTYFTKAPTTRTVTATTTAYASTTTVYAACASNNLADYYTPNSQSFSGGQPYKPSTFSSFGATSTAAQPSAYACCVAALLYGASYGDGTAAALFTYVPSNSACIVYYTVDTCPSLQAYSLEAFTITPPNPNYDPAVIGNLPCGLVDLVQSLE